MKITHAAAFALLSALAACYRDDPPQQRRTTTTTTGPTPVQPATTATTPARKSHCDPTPYAGCSYQDWIDRCGANGERCPR